MTDTVATVTALTRSWMNDVAGNVFTDALLIPFVASAYRSLQKDFARNGIKRTEADAVITLAVGGVKIMDSPVAPDSALPSDFLLPSKLEEKGTGTSELYTPMTETPGGLPQRSVLGETLDYWRYFDEQIRVTGATRSIDIRLSYVRRSLPDLALANDPILVRGAVDALAYATAAMAARARGVQGKAHDMMNGYTSEMRSLVSIAAQAKQSSPARRRPYSARFRR